MSARLLQEAAREAARLPALLAEARVLAATVEAGAHGRRREGAGEAFWAFRPYRSGDEPRRIDWRRSAKGDEVLVREREQATAATVLVWPDRGPGMRWRSTAMTATKADRATVLALALATLLGRGGERCGLLGGGRPATGLQAADRLAEALTLADGTGGPALASAGGQLVLLTDGLDPRWTRALETPGQAGGVVVRISDPAEVDFPYAGATVFSAPGGATERRLGRAEAVGPEYREAWRGHGEEMSRAAVCAGLRYLEHRTDAPAAAGLLALWRVVSGAG